MKLFSTEQISLRHPDSLADLISDTLLTEILKQDNLAQCGIETMYKDDTVVLGGEVTTIAKINYEQIVFNTLRKLKQPIKQVINLIGEQSREINRAVVTEKELTAGDQGMMFGYATNETKSMLPFGFDLANDIIAEIEWNSSGFFKGDAKCQITVDLDKEGVDSLHTILVSVCHFEEIQLEEVKNEVKMLVEGIILNKYLKKVDFNTIKLIINPAGVWNQGGSISDCGLTGRKIIANSYGSYAPVGGGCFSGKSATKVDRSGAYMARYLAKWAIKSFNLKECTIQLAYAIGVAKPISINVISNIPQLDHYITQEIEKKFDLTPQGIIDKFNLYNVDYSKVGGRCHFMDQTLPWEQVVD